MPAFRLIPSIDALLTDRRVAASIDTHGRPRVVSALRAATEALRAAYADGGNAPATSGDAASWITTRMDERLRAETTPSLRRVINATGVILHTNLGRAPLADAVVARIAEIAGGYSNLEYDLDNGGRGRRDMHAERLLRDLTGAEAAVVVNNNAGATLLVLTALAAGREVIVSRGELVEIGGGFRVPDVMAQSGAVLREVGTTNRTRTADYAAAITDKTALILRVHPSNFRIVGFAERPALADLAALGLRFTIPVFEDLGSGWIAPSDTHVAALSDEPNVRTSLLDGADLVAFSGDKLLGGPQAGIIVGRRELVDRVRRHPLMRALRADKLTYAALEATLELWLSDDRQDVPVFRMMTMSVDAVAERARALVRRLGAIDGLRAEIVDGVSTTGGGSAPRSALPTALIALHCAGESAAHLEARLRADDPPVIARIEHDRVVIDLRTVREDEEDDVVRAIGGFRAVHREGVKP